ncbi:tRNA (guanosine(37)-N1)-methyltransferase TrmD [Blochmannia endosymbiont of Camponotus (Colobopsis) obliquus]|uniref:tRNA (guanosine(37)-N1)-methyltransferase TrmD n=1 Tax=Blochmannia endosymbiont of Camponotus (Colobopsis) obliquus TaxID=1505597 RepID=UPI00061A8053|nr:tRNA (guanosine(37)-N1)-methyltransferase TrmD [Blochmannia endosymbiont of Camponotus (Colobopsis) obliquus]AKC60349.1 tRNA (guanine-N(1)-)-methyltransferase [Blochmannia endosymbiont of Camponotus (Colobopsis) obliquus]
MQIGIVSLFSQMFHAITNFGVTSRAIKKGILHLEFWNPRDFTTNHHRTIDDRPYGGGPGMLMMMQPLREAIHAAKYKIGSNGEYVNVVYLSPQGCKLDYQGVKELSSNLKLILVCGRYEGVDERLIESEVDKELSIGDYILSGGELAAMVLIDAMVRLLPGVLGNQMSSISDSFAYGILDHPNYTRPKILNNMQVPAILLSGHHRKIYQWRLKQALGRTWLRRPDLFKKLKLNKEQKKLLSEFQSEY